MIISVFDSVGNIVGKGEKAGCQHFLLSSQCFKKAFFPDTSKGVNVWEWVNALVKYINLCQPVQSMQTDMGLYFLLSIKFSACQGIVLPYESVCCETEWIL